MRLVIEVNGPEADCNKAKELVWQNPHTMRIIEDDTYIKINRFGELEIDPRKRQVLLRGKKVSLTAMEFDILNYLASYPGYVFSHRQIYEAVWKKDYFQDAANITAHIGHIRKKLEPDIGCPKYIQTVYGVGYKFAEAKQMQNIKKEK